MQQSLSLVSTHFGFKAPSKGPFIGKFVKRRKFTDHKSYKIGSAKGCCFRNFGKVYGNP